jgi:hypothetical protein
LIGRTIVTALEMPIHPSPTVPAVAFTSVSALLVLALIAYWFASGEFRRNPVLPLILVGTSISAIVVEPVFDNTLLYWYPPDNALGLYSAFDRPSPGSSRLGTRGSSAATHMCCGGCSRRAPAELGCASCTASSC